MWLTGIATVLGIYLFVSIACGIKLGILVASDLWHTWIGLSILQWIVVSALLCLHSFWYGLWWPQYVWQEDKRNRENRAYIRAYARMYLGRS
jgi:hypothetical protein